MLAKSKELGTNGTLVRETFDKLTTILGTEHVDTIQLLSVSDDDVKSWNWRIFSRSLDEFSKAVYAFTGKNEHEATDEVEETLAFEDCDDPRGYWYDRWGRVKVPVAIKEPCYEGSAFGPSKPKHELPQKELLRHWRNALERQYLAGGSSIWVSLKHPLRTYPEPVCSSAYAVFTSELNDEEQRMASRLLKQMLIDHLVHFYDRQINRQYSDMASALLNYIKSNSQFEIIAEKARERLQALIPVITHRIPILVEGVTGTGKLTAARLAIKLLVEHDKSHGRDTKGGPIILSGYELSGDRASCAEKLRSHGLWDGTKVDPTFSGMVIFDDVHLASREAQHMMERLISSRLHNEFVGTPTPFFVLTVAPDSKTAVRDKHLIEALESVAGACRVTLPSLDERLAELSESRRVEVVVKILKEYLKDIQPIIPTFVPNMDYEAEAKNVIYRSWHGNYSQLRQYVFEKVLDGLARKISPDAA